MKSCSLAEMIFLFFLNQNSLSEKVVLFIRNYFLLNLSVNFLGELTSRQIL